MKSLAWTRATDGVLAGVCKGLAKRFELDVMLVRLAWVASVLLFGFGIGAYIILAIGLPREDKIAQAYEARILGVSARFAKRFDLDVGLTRVGFLTLLFLTCGSMFFAYLIMYLILPKQSEFQPEQANK